MEKRTLQWASCSEVVGKDRVSSNPNDTSRNIRRHHSRKWFAGVLVSVGVFISPSNANAGRIGNGPPLSRPPVAESTASQAAQPGFRLPQVPRMEFEGGTFGLESSPEGLSLVYEKDGIRHGVRLSLPAAEILGEITTVHYGKSWSAILTRNQGTGENYAIVTLGAADVAAGRELLPGNEFLSADCIVLPEPHNSHSFAEDKLFLFYGEGIVRVLDASGRLRRLTVEGASEGSEAVRYMGLYILMQTNGTPVIFLKENGDSWEAQGFEYDSSELRQLQGYSVGSPGLSVRFLNSEGQPIELMVTVGEEGNLETVRIEER